MYFVDYKKINCVKISFFYTFILAKLARNLHLI